MACRIHARAHAHRVSRHLHVHAGVLIGLLRRDGRLSSRGGGEQANEHQQRAVFLRRPPLVRMTQIGRWARSGVMLVTHHSNDCKRWTRGAVSTARLTTPDEKGRAAICLENRGSESLADSSATIRHMKDKRSVVTAPEERSYRHHAATCARPPRGCALRLSSMCGRSRGLCEVRGKGRGRDRGLVQVA